jgi:hypothetical protein
MQVSVNSVARAIGFVVVGVTGAILFVSSLTTFSAVVLLLNAPPRFALLRALMIAPITSSLTSFGIILLAVLILRFTIESITSKNRCHVRSWFWWQVFISALILGCSILLLQVMAANLGRFAACYVWTSRAGILIGACSAFWLLTRDPDLDILSRTSILRHLKLQHERVSEKTTPKHIAMIISFLLVSEALFLYMIGTGLFVQWILDQHDYLKHTFQTLFT